MIKTEASTIRLSKKAFQRGVVILGMDEYWELMKNSVPTVYLRGKKAKELDRLVGDGLRAHKEGKTRKLGSLADLR